MAVKLEEEFWNSINLIAPPFSTYSVNRRNFVIENFKKCLENAIAYFTDQTSYYEEVNQISQMIYLGKSQFRMMKGFQEMKKTHQAAIRLKRLNIVDILEAFNSYVADDFQSEILLPSKQNLDYVLIKLQGVSKILIRIITCSRKSSRYFLGLIRMGSFYLKGSVFVSTLAKIWDMSRQMCQYTIVLYNNLRQFRVKLKEIKNCEWIANNCELPEKLEDWLGDEYEYFVNNETYDAKLLTKSDEIENFRNEILQVTETLKKFKTDEKVVKSEPKDILELVPVKVEKMELEIDDFKPISRTEVTKVEYEHSLSSVSSRENVKLFLKFEDKYRKLDMQKSITIKRIKQKAWKEIKDDLKNKLLLMQESSLVEYFHDNLNHYMSVE
ncbi:nucleolus and neural progenitor protein [Chironomus tepperi]|uniref:nucleolus and neural progenitor protein n=1 Tax=Chironomus tepperi TaxID=113505 RepID=UPI00391F6F2C